MARKTDIRLRRSNTAGAIPSGSNLNEGELAINTADGALYFKKSDSTVITAHDNTIMHIDSQNNRVGIGTTSPATSLHISESSDQTSPQLRITNDNSESLTIGVVRSVAGTAPDTALIQFDNALRFIGQTGTTNERMRITEAGNVGIGTTSPAFKLSVDSGTSDWPAHFKSTDNKAGIIIADNDTTAYFGAESSKAFMGLQAGIHANNLNIDSSGNVGIGTLSPSEKLHVKDTVFIDYPDGSGVSLKIGRNDSSNYWEVGHAGADFRLYNPSGSGSDILFGVDNSGIDQGNKVGIGTATPDKKLTVDGDVKIGNGDAFMSANVAGSTRSLISLGTDNILRIKGNDAEGSSNVISMIAGGNVGIGTTTPSQKLEVDGAILIKDSNTVGTLYLTNTSVGIKRSNAVDTTNSRDIEVFTDGSGANIVFSTNGAGSADVVIKESGRLDAPSMRTATIEGDGTNSALTITQANTDIDTQSDDINIITAGGGRNASTGSINITTLNTSNYASGGINLTTGNTSGNVNSGDITLTAGSSTYNGGATIEAGSVYLIAGDTSSTTNNTKQAGSVYIEAGTNTVDSPRSGDIIFTTNNSERARVDSGGGVLIGNATNFSDSNADDLQVGNTSGAHGITIVAQNSHNASIYFADNDNNDAGRIAYNHTNNRMEFYTNRSQRMVITSAGNVGIGTNAAAQKLDVRDGDITTRDSTNTNYAQLSRYVGLILKGNGTGARGVKTPNTDALTLGTNDTERVRILSDGKVIIGDTASHTTDLLQIETPASGGGHGIQIRRNDANNDQGIGHILFGNNTDTDLVKISAKTDLDSNAGDSGALLFSTQPTSGSLTERMRIDSSGNVGIGDTAPSFPLDVNNTSTRVRFKATTGHSNLELSSIAGRDYLLQSLSNGEFTIHDEDSNANRLNISTAGAITFNNAFTFPTSIGSAGQVLKVPSTGTSLIWADDAGGGSATVLTDTDGDTLIQVEESADEDIIRFDTAGTQRMVITDVGRVGINTQSPAAMLHVNGGIVAVGDGTNTTYYEEDKIHSYATSGFIIDGREGITLETTSDDKDINFKIYDTTNGLETYMSVDGGEGRVIFNKWTRHVDGARILVGTGGDLAIYHDGSNSYIAEQGTGVLNISGSTQVNINAANGENGIQVIEDAGVRLRHNNNVKLDTTSTGVDITGELQSDSLDVDGNADISGNLVLGGNLTVQGTTTTLNTATLDVEDKNITLNYGSGDTSSSADGAGITIQDAVDASTDASLTWNASDDNFEISHGLDFGDNSKVRFGASNDLQIYHDGSASYISDQGTGNLKLLAGSFRLRNAADTENIMQGNQNGTVSLYYDNSVKFATTSTGIDVTGTVTADGLTVDGESYLGAEQANPVRINSSTAVGILEFNSTTGIVRADGTGQLLFETNGSTDRLKIANNGDISFYEDTGSTAKFFWDASAGRLGIGTSLPESLLHIDGSSGLLINDSATNSATKTSFIPINNGGNSRLKIKGGNYIHSVAYETSWNDFEYASLVSSYNTTDSRFDLNKSASDGSTAATTRISTGTSYFNGDVGIGTTSPGRKLSVSGAIELTTADTTVHSSHAAIRRGGAGEMFLDAPGDIHVNLDTNNNNTDRAFRIRTNATTTDLFTVNESGNATLSGNLETTSYLSSSAGAYFNTNTGSNPVYITRSGNTDQALKIYTDDANVIFESIQDESLDNYGGFIFAMDSGTTHPFFDVRKGTSSSGTKFRVDGSGNVGINEANPDSRLHITGTDGGWDKHITIEHNSSDIGKILVDTDGMKLRNMSSGNGFYFRDSANATQMVIDSSGQVGIGVGSNPGQKLDVGGIIRSSATNPQLRIHTSSGTGTGYLVYGDSADDDIGQIYYSHANNEMGFVVNGGSAKMLIDSSGNVGVGVTSIPSWANFMTHGTVAVGGILYIKQDQKIQALTAYPGGAGYLRINPDGGNVGIGMGTSTPKAKLQIEEYGIDTSETTTTAATQVAIHTFPIADFRTARFTIQITNTTDSTYHSTEIIAVHDGTTATITEFGEVHTGSSVEATFDADINSNNFRLLATPSSTDSMTFKVVCHSITV